VYAWTGHAWVVYGDSWGVYECTGDAWVCMGTHGLCMGTWSDVLLRLVGGLVVVCCTE